MEQRGVSAVKIAMVYIGTVVGAGFATGQEILQFFVSFGLGGLWGILLSTGLFILFGVLIMKIGLRLSAQSHFDVLGQIGGPLFQAAMDGLIMLSLFGGLTAMMAGTGAMFAQQLGLSPALGNALMGLLTAITVLRGLRGVIAAISAVVPFLLVSVLLISLFTLKNAPPDFQLGLGGTGSGLLGNWLWAAILYTSYNIILSASVLGPLGAEAKHRRTVLLGGALGGLGLGFASLMIYLAISASGAEVSYLEVPMLHMALQIAPIAGVLFSLVLVAEIYTTAVGALYGFSARLMERNGRQGIAKITLTVSAAFFASLLGFSNLVRYLYPLQGYGGIVLLLALLWAWHKGKV